MKKIGHLVTVREGGNNQVVFSTRTSDGSAVARELAKKQMSRFPGDCIARISRDTGLWRDTRYYYVQVLGRIYGSYRRQTDDRNPTWQLIRGIIKVGNRNTVQ